MSLYFEWRKSCGCRVPCDCDSKTNQENEKQPKLFFTQSDEMLTIPPDTPTNAIELEVTTFSPNTMVKLDSMIETFVLTGREQHYSFIVEYYLMRKSTPITSESFAMINQLGQPDCEKTIMNTTKITWNDIVPLPGKHTYLLEVNHITLPNQNIESVELQDRSLTAITFSPN
ncbi:hypothetical protein [Sutcliffiella rhizosphaerae]|uniref:Uncharacterized protein n=1 Tax=Sutcliffiella rhizosphaerae TaxID=2880967 RepID=A0ABN8AHQ4_9BACI|nr:hypothetical protein [Sutcliffiella rhizosphaerae]CAG9623247.1 hypothetical protein BACCIP111883_04043 [Sutcliffiella rhizosphaerae]